MSLQLVTTGKKIGQSESALRRRAGREGYYIHKSRRRHSINNRGEYGLFDQRTSFPVIGWHYGATLEDIAEYLSD